MAAKKKKHQTKATPAAPAAASDRKSPWTLASPWVIAILLALTTAIVYLKVRHYGFVDYDDGDYVNGNRHVDTGLTWANVKWAFTTGHASNWHPLTWLSHMLDYQLFGKSTGAQHLVSVSLHVFNTVLLFLVLRRMTGAHWRSALVAALFGLHPIHVESVAWLSERKDVLSTAFLLLTLGAYTEYALRRKFKNIEGEAPDREAPQLLSDPQGTCENSPGLQAGNRRPHHDGVPKGRQKSHGNSGLQQTEMPPPNRSEIKPDSHTTLYYALALLFLALGLMSKPMLVTTPFVLLLLDYWPLQRLDLAAAKIRNVWPLLLEKLPFFLLVIASSIITFNVQREGGAVSTALTVTQRLGNAVISYARYLGKTALPTELAVLYPHPGSWPIWAVIGATLLVLFLCVMALRLARTQPYVPVGWFWFLGTLVPVIGIVQVGIQSMADRYSYVPCVGIFIIVAWGGWEIAQRSRWRSEALQTVAAIALALCALLTLRQVQFWENTETLFRRAVEVEPKNYLAYNNLGFYMANHGRINEAIENYRKSLEINASYSDALHNMGHALYTLGRPVEAIPFYEAALRSNPKNPAETHNNFGNALSDVGRLDEAIDHYQSALKINPDLADAHNNLGITLAMKGRLADALVHFREAIRLKPDYANAHSNLGNAYAVQQQWDQAIHEYQECLRSTPNDPQAHFNLGNVFLQQGKLEDAASHYLQAIAVNTSNEPRRIRDKAEAHFNLGLTLLRLNKRAEAKEHFHEALKLKPDYTQAREQLAALGG